MEENQIEIGMRVRDKVTGFEGVCTARTVWMYSAPSVAIEQRCSNGKLEEPKWFSVGRIEVLEGPAEAEEA